MRLLVISDSHGDEDAVRRALLEQPRAEVVFHLGDGVAEAERVAAAFAGEKAFFFTRGNNDWGCPHAYAGELTLEGRKIFYTHGHLYHVKYGLTEVVEAARARGADLLLFGHTHMPLADYQEGLYIINPGSLAYSVSGPPAYGVVDLTDAGVVPNIVNLRR